MLAEAAVRRSLMCSLIVRNPTPLSSVAQYVDLPDYSCTCFTTSPIDQQRSSTNELVAPLKRAPQAIPTYERKFYGTVKVSFQSQTGSTGHSDFVYSTEAIDGGQASIPNGLHRPFRRDLLAGRSSGFCTTVALFHQGIFPGVFPRSARWRATCR